MLCSTWVLCVTRSGMYDSSNFFRYKEIIDKNPLTLMSTTDIASAKHRFVTEQFTSRNTLLLVNSVHLGVYTIINVQISMNR